MLACLPFKFLPPSTELDLTRLELVPPHQNGRGPAGFRGKPNATLYFDPGRVSKQARCSSFHCQSVGKVLACTYQGTLACLQSEELEREGLACSQGRKEWDGRM